MPRPEAPALPLRPVVEDHAAAALITLAYDDTRAAIMHDIGVAAIQRGGDVFGDDRRIEIVPRAFPDAGVVSHRSHAVPIAGMVAADLTERIRSGGLLCFCSHSRCGYPFVGFAGAQERSGETMNSLPTTAVCQRRDSRLGLPGGRVPCRAVRPRSMPERRDWKPSLDESGTGESELADMVSGEQRTEAQAPTPDVVSRFGPELAQLTVVMLWASTFVAAKAAFAEVSPLAFLLARFVIMVTLAFAVLLVLQRGAGRWVDRSDWGLVALAGLTGYTLYQLGFILGLSRTSPFSSSLLIAMVPLFTVLILAVMGEPTPLQGWLGLGVALIGVAFFLLDKRGASSGTLLGDLLSIGAAISFATYGIITRPLVKKYPAETVSAWSVFAGAIPLFVICLPSALRQDWMTLSGAAWLTIVYLAIFPVYIAYILWNFAIAQRGVAKATTFSLLVPIVAGGLSAVYFGEPFGPLKLLGAGLVLAGLVIVRTREWRRPAAKGSIG